jgi:hypothetical protein
MMRESRLDGKIPASCLSVPKKLSFRSEEDKQTLREFVGSKAAFQGKGKGCRSPTPISIKKGGASTFYVAFFLLQQVRVCSK